MFIKKSNRHKIRMLATIPEKGDEFAVVEIENYLLPFVTTHQHLNKFTVYKLNKRPFETNKSSDCMFL